MIEKLTQEQLTRGLTEELFDVISKYDGSIPMATFVGVLELLKNDLINNHSKSVLNEMIEEKRSSK